MKSEIYLLCLAALVASAACDKSPSSPAVTITAPRLLSPAQGASLSDAQQPLTLIVENANTTGKAPLTYLFQVASDEGFASLVVSRDGVTEGSGGTAGQTRLALPDRLASGRSYWWRAQARDASTAGAMASAARFELGPAVRLDPPALLSPDDGGSAMGRRPTFVVRNSTRSGPVGVVTYSFEVSENDAFTAIAVHGQVPEQGEQTSFTPEVDLPTDRTLFWRARASDGAATSGWSSGRFRVAEGIDLRTAIFVKGPNVHSWAETSRITDVRISASQICVEHTRLGQWPPVPFFDDPGTTAEGNFGFCANTKYMANGDGRDQWYCAAAFWNRPGQACKGENAETLHETWYLPNEEPLRSWVPRPGEPFGIYITTPSRFWPNMKTTDERTNVVLMKWPG